MGKRILSLALLGTLLFGLAVESRAQEGASSNLTVITSDEITRDKPASITDLLRQKVGVDVNGSEINMRGVKGVVVVVDDAPQNTIPPALKPEDVERIEILRGAASSRYGASAMGGAVVISTKKGDKKRSLDLIQGYGSFDRRYTRVIGNGSIADWKLRLSVEENVKKRIYEVEPEDTPFSYMVYVEDDYARSRSADVRAGKKGEGFETDLNLNYREGKSGYGRPNYWSESKTFKARWSSKIMPSEWLELSPVIFLDDMFDYDGVRDKGTGTDAVGLAPDRRVNSPSGTHAIELEAKAVKGNMAGLAAGLRYGVEGGSTTIRDYNTDQLRFDYRYKMSEEAAFFTFEAKPLESVSLEMSGRYDRYRYFDVYIDDAKSRISGEPLVKESFNPKAGFKWNSSERFSFRGTVSTGFVPPSPYNLYFKDTGSPARILNNPGLKPETSVTMDLGVDVVLPYGLSLSLTPFYTLWKDKVVKVYTVDGASSTQQPENIGESVAWGFELQVNEKINERWSAFFNYTFNRTEITKNDADRSIVGNRVPDMPENKFNAGLAYQKEEDFNLKLSWRYVGSRFLDEKNTVRDERGVPWQREAYSVFDLIFMKYIKPGGRDIENMELTLAIDNAFDERYGEWFFYRNPGRVVRLEAAARF